MRALFVLGWLASLAFMALCHGRWSQALAQSLDPGDFWVLVAVGVILPWAAGPGMMPVLRRMQNGGINLPHADYWFNSERRAASLDRLAPYTDAMGLLLSVFLSTMLALDLWHGLQGQRTPVGQHLTATAAFVAATGIWTWALLHAFPAPPRHDLTRQVDDSRRPRQPK